MKLIKELYGCADGEVYPVMRKPGDECPPELEEAARAIGAVDAEAERLAAEEAAKAEAGKGKKG